MDRKEIARRASVMQTKEDLLALLNDIKRAELEEIGLQDQFHPFTIKHLNFYCNPNHACNRYMQFEIKKKSGKLRTITAPKTRTYMMMLQAVNKLLASMYTPSDYAMGFAEGRSVATNASVHIGQNYVLNIDLKDFFPSVEQPRVWKRLQLKPFGFPVRIASLIAGLCAMRDTRVNSNGIVEDAYVLPQGSPTSPIITNMICDTLDRRLAGLAKRFGLRYTRYADDITFSSKHYVYARKGVFRNELQRIIEGQGFKINAEKTRLQKRGTRQEVTGVVVNEKLNVAREYVREIRSILYIWEKYGFMAVWLRFLPKYKAEKGHVKKGVPDLINVVDGKLLYLKMLKGDDDAVYMRLYDRFRNLVEGFRYSCVTTDGNVTYVETVLLEDFEKKYNTKVSMTRADSLSEPVLDDAESELDERMASTRRYARFYFAGMEMSPRVNKSVSTEDEKNKSSLAISLCRNEKGNEFWLIHHKNKRIVPCSQIVDIDKLNDDLDFLIKIQNG